MAKLKVVQGSNAGTEFDLPEEGTLTLGRRSSCDVQVPDAKASRVHAELVVSQGYVYIRDLGSRNGTRMNGRRLDEEALEVIEVGDRLEIGEIVMELTEVRSAEELDVEIPGYEMIERIGAGGMGTVYKARQVSMDRVVAMKVLHRELCEDSDFIQRFVQEARAAGRLSHPNIVHVFDVNKSNNIYFFSMEYVDGGNVKRLLKKDGKIEPGRAVKIVLQAAQALAYAHSQGIIHRDVKPDNLMLTREGEAKLADLGIARTFEEQDESGKATRVYGTPHYMAPEQALGKPVDARADVYSLGATLYHMLTGRTPFSGASATEVLKAHIQEELPPITESAPEVSEALCHVCERMMSKKPEKRYQRMEEVIVDLEKVKKDASVAIAAPEPGESSVIPAATPQAAEFRRRRAMRKRPAWKKAAGTGGVIAVLVVLAVGAYIITQVLVGTNSSGTYQVPDPEAGQRKAQAALDDCVDLKRKGRLDEARTAFYDFISKYPEYPKLCEEAGDHIKDLDQKIADRRYKRAQEAFEKARDYYNKNPDNLKETLTMLDEVCRTYSGTPGAAAAGQLAREIEDRMGQQSEGMLTNKLELMRARVSALRAERKYDEATQVMTEFVARYSDAGVAGDAQADLDRIKKEIEDIYRRAEKEAQDHAAAKRWGAAVRGLALFIKDYSSVQWRSEAKTLSDKLQQDAMNDFKERVKEPNQMVLEYKFDDALAKYKILRTQFDGTRWGGFAIMRIASIQSQADLHSEVAHRVRMQAGKGSPPRLPFTLKSFTRMHFRIVDANEQSITVESESEPKVRQPVTWTGLTAREVYQIYRLYLPNPTADEHAWLAEFCQERDLVDEADKHFEAAEE